MSRHHIQFMHECRPILVVAGYDRPLHELFLQVFLYRESHSTDEDDSLYDSLHEPALDWTMISTLTGKLHALRIEVPASLIEAVHSDQCFNAGNIVVRYHAGQPTELKMVD